MKEKKKNTTKTRKTKGLRDIQSVITYSKKKKKKKVKREYNPYRAIFQEVLAGSSSIKKLTEGNASTQIEDNTAMYPDRDHLNTYPDRFPAYHEPEDDGMPHGPENVPFGILQGLLYQTIIANLEQKFIAGQKNRIMRKNWTDLLKLVAKNIQNDKNQAVKDQYLFRYEMEKTFQQYEQHLQHLFEAGEFDPAEEAKLLELFIQDMKNAAAINHFDTMDYGHIKQLQYEVDRGFRDIYREHLQFQEQSKLVYDELFGFRDVLKPEDITREFGTYLREFYKPGYAEPSQVVKEFYEMKINEGYTQASFEALTAKMDEWLHNTENATKLKQTLQNFFTNDTVPASTLLEDAVDVMELIPDNVQQLLDPNLFTPEEIKELVNASGSEFDTLLDQYENELEKLSEELHSEVILAPEVEQELIALQELTTNKLKALDLKYGVMKVKSGTASGSSPWTKSKKEAEIRLDYKKKYDRIVQKNKGKIADKEAVIERLRAKQGSRLRYRKKLNKIRREGIRINSKGHHGHASSSSSHPRPELHDAEYYDQQFHIDDDAGDIIVEGEDPNHPNRPEDNWGDDPFPEDGDGPHDDYLYENGDENKPLIDRDQPKFHNTKEYQNYIKELKEDIKAKSPSYATEEGAEQLEHMTYKELIDLHAEEMYYHSDLPVDYIKSFLTHIREVGIGENPDLVFAMSAGTEIAGELLEGLFSLENIGFVLMAEALQYTAYHPDIPYYYYDDVSKTYKWSTEQNGFHEPLQKMLHNMKYYEFMKLYAKHKYIYTALAVLTADPILGTASLVYWGSDFRENENEQAILKEMADKGESTTAMYSDRTPYLTFNAQQTDTFYAQQQSVEAQILPLGEYDPLGGGHQYGPSTTTQNGTWYMYFNTNNDPLKAQLPVDSNGTILDYSTLWGPSGSYTYATVNQENPEVINVTSNSGYGNVTITNNKVHYAGQAGQSAHVMNPNSAVDAQLMHDLFAQETLLDNRTPQYMTFTTYDENKQELTTWGTTFFHTNPKTNIHPTVMKGILSGDLEAKFLHKEHWVPPEPDKEQHPILQIMDVVGLHKPPKTKPKRPKRALSRRKIKK